MSLVDTGPPRTVLVGERVGVAGGVSWQWAGFVGMPLVHPNGIKRPWVPWCGYSALPLQSVFNLSIAESTVTDTLESRSHHGSTDNKILLTKFNNFGTIINWWKSHRDALRPSMDMLVIIGKVTIYILLK